MKQKLFGFLRKDRRGLALISVLGVVTLATILIVALFSISDAEYKSSQVYSAGTTARRLADNAIAIVIGQIQSAATGTGVPGISPTGPANVGATIWASQPGAVRVYGADGLFRMGRTLYSSSQMIYTGAGMTGEEAMVTNIPSATWASNLDQWVDLNRPVERANGSATPDVFFPIFDPRAAPPLVPAAGTPSIDSLKDADGNPSPQGFWLWNKTPGNGRSISAESVGVVRSGAQSSSWRLPMPVEWLYILKDGQVGTVSTSSPGKPSRWVGVGGNIPTEKNPIIGRVGFWTDDECCKININTAGEPGYWAPPSSMHERERHWADSPPALFEYQRYPGHPATVALSTVFAPTFNPKTYYPPPQTYPDANLVFKNAIYDFVPKLAISSTNDGQIAFEPNDILLGGSQAKQDADLAAAHIVESMQEPLFSSVDEAMFTTRAAGGAGGGDTRKVRTFLGPTGKAIISQGDATNSALRIERARAFLTAHSRAPETNMFGLPRVAIWPVPDSSTPKGGTEYHAYRTAFDTEIALCAKLGSTTQTPELETANSYYFRRLDPSSHLTDMGRDPTGGTGAGSGLARNAQLMGYLDNLVHMIMPGGKSFAVDKYTDGDAQQILVEIFDYIRCTNLYDGSLAVKNNDKLRRDNSLPDKLTTPISVLWDSTPRHDKYFTYTVPRFTVKRAVNDAGLTSMTVQEQNKYKQDPEWVATGTYPGHGQVRPIEWTDGKSGRTYKGFGRFPTISEVGLQFICTADGKTDDGSYTINSFQGPIKSGGKTAEKLDPKQPNQRKVLTKRDPTGRGKEKTDYFFSNFPPMPSADLFYTQWGCNPAHYQQGQFEDSILNHPALDATNWNCTLDVVNGHGVPLKEDEMRIQICLNIETFVPAVGYTRYNPDFTIVMNSDQMQGIKVMNSLGALKSVFSGGDKVVLSSLDYTGDSSGRGLNASREISPLGGSNAPAALTNGRLVAGQGAYLPKDVNESGVTYQDRNTSGGGNLHATMLNYPLVSNFTTVKARSGPSGTPLDLKFTVESPLEIDIYATHDYKGNRDPANGQPVQKIYINFPSGVQSAPMPQLVVYSNERIYRTDANGNLTDIQIIPAPHWWAFNYEGAVNRLTADVTLTAKDVQFSNVKPVSANTINGARTYGRFHSTGYTAGVGSSGSRGQVPVSGLVYGYANYSIYSGVVSQPKDNINGGYAAGGNGSAGTYKYFGSDMVRSMIPNHGDYRILAAKKVVDGQMWQPHPVWFKRPKQLFAHSFSGAYSDAVVGFDLNGGSVDDVTVVDPKYRLVPKAYYESGTSPGDNKSGFLAVVPDTPLTEAAAKGSARYRDFDNGPGNLRDGAYINKADDGSLGAMKFWHGGGANDKSGVRAGVYLIRNTYFSNSFLQLPSTENYSTPNRIISSPGMFGSLPTGVFGSLYEYADNAQRENAKRDGIPWRTLLFRADVDGHVGAPSWSKGEGDAKKTGVAPADHYFMDLFFMPIVEPYAITDSYATAGKINLNYQIVPFTYIRRATAVYAAMKGEMITAYSSGATDPRKGSLPPSATNTAVYKTIKDTNPIPPVLWDDSDGMRWQREINLDETVKQLDERFAFISSSAAVGNVGLMLTASQLCELHLIPDLDGKPAPAVGELPREPELTGLTQDTRLTAMRTYWKHNDLTGDNTRERPYANLYQKFTTRSNTFRVYFTAQTLKKARSLEPNEVDTRKDTVTSEYRGSALFERYLDLSTSGAAVLSAYDYGAATNLTALSKSLESFYHYRIIELKQFAP